MGQKNSVSDMSDFFTQIDQMLNKIFSEEDLHMSPDEYMHYYSLIFETYNSKWPSNEDSNHWTKDNNSVETIYNRIKTFIGKHLDSIRQKSIQYPDEESLLKFYTNQWQIYQIRSKVLNGICNYINRLVDGIKMHKVGDLTKIEWRDTLLHEFGAKVSKSVLKLIEKDRQRDVIDTSLVRVVIESFVELSKVEDGNDANGVKVFEESFKKPFLVQTQEFYSREREAILLENSFYAYVEKVTLFIKDEKERCDRFLGPVFHEPLIASVRNTLILEKIDRFKLEFQSLVVSDDTEQLKKLYDLVKFVPSVISELCLHFESQVKKEGSEVLSGVTLQAVDNPRVYVQTIWKVYNKYRNLSILSLESDNKFREALDSAAMAFINDNSVTHLSNSKKSAELLAKYFDSLLKIKGNKDKLDDNEVERLLLEAIEIFRFIRDKDVFNQFYEKLMARRMISELTANDELESMVLTKFNDIYGCDYTSKLRAFFQDMKLSKELDEKFRAINSDTSSVDFSVKVMSQSVSPFQSKECKAMIPSEMGSLYSSYQVFYISKYQGRQLSWLNNMAKAVITATYVMDRKYYITASAYQSTIILLFNTTESMTIQQIIDNTRIDQRVVIEILKIILQTKLLLSADNHLSNESTIRLNTEYNNKKRKFNINKPIKVIDDEEEKRTHQQIDQNRKFVIQAAIVRIMKTHKRLVHNDLVTRVLHQIGAKFSPTMAMIKKGIDDLIGKDYLAKVSDTKDTYIYVA